VSGQIQYGPAVAPTPGRTADAAHRSDDAHLLLPVRFGRRRTDQVGHLAFGSQALSFTGTIELSIPWTNVSRVRPDENRLIVSLHDSRRLLCFCCQGADDAARGAVVASHLATLAQSEPLEPA
jgi:hypothetical protein